MDDDIGEVEDSGERSEFGVQVRSRLVGGRRHQEFTIRSEGTRFYVVTAVKDALLFADPNREQARDTVTVTSEVASTTGSSVSNLRQMCLPTNVPMT